MPVNDPSLSVLFVDDDRDYLTAVLFALETIIPPSLNIRPVTARSIEEAIHAYRLHAPAVIYVDMVMETPDAGMKLLQHVRDIAEDRVTQVVLRTGMPHEYPPARLCAEYGLNGFEYKAGLSAQAQAISLITAINNYRTARSLQRLTDKLADCVALTLDRKGSEQERPEAILRDYLARLLHLDPSQVTVAGFGQVEGEDALLVPPDHASHLLRIGGTKLVMQGSRLVGAPVVAGELLSIVVELDGEIPPPEILTAANILLRSLARLGEVS